MNLADTFTSKSKTLNFQTTSKQHSTKALLLVGHWLLLAREIMGRSSNSISCGMKESWTTDSFFFLDKRKEGDGGEERTGTKNKRHARGYRAETLARGCLVA